MDSDEGPFDEEEEYYYSDGAESDSDSGDSAGREAAGEGLMDVLSQRVERYVALTEEDISRRQEDAVREVAGVLSIPGDSAFLLLRHHHWIPSKLHDEWFADEERVRRAVGLAPDDGAPGPRGELTCAICFDEYPATAMRSSGCSHYFCLGCWRGYIAASVDAGPGCLSLRCPDPSCSAAVLRELVKEVAEEWDWEMYAQFALRSYVEDNKKTRWCPAPDCDCAVELTGSGNYDVWCRCGFGFCWQCGEEAHRPVNCETVAKWVLKNSSESENMNWILANSKPCPVCRRPIEKNQGCMHMTCSEPCGFQFCWLCLSAWSTHGENSGGFYKCNRYEEAKTKGTYNEEEERRNRAKQSLERYMHFYERWASNHTSREKAQQELQTLNSTGLRRLREAIGVPETELQFLSEAWSQIIECRRVLKWTYSYGYFIDKRDVAKRHFFDYLQGEAEHALERLHQCAELDAWDFLGAKRKEDYSEFRVQLVDLTRVTRNYFNNLIQALEAGLSDVQSKTTH